MQNVLVTGGAGFIGSHLCRELLKKSYHVVCVDNLITGSYENIEEFKINHNFEFIKLDVAGDKFNASAFNSKFDYIVHLASPASPNKKSDRSYLRHPIETLLVNSHGTHRLLELAREKNSAFLFISTSEVYGDPLQSPQKEDYFGNVNPNGPRSVYDESKRFGEAITMAYVRKYSLNGRIVRVFNTYGPYMQVDDGRVISNFIVQALTNKKITVYGDGKQTRSFCYVEDMVEGISLALFSEGITGEVINLGNPDERTIGEIATIIKEMTGSFSETVYDDDLPEDDPKTRKPDIGKAKRLLKWEPKVKLEDGLKKTIEYFKEIL